MKKNVSKKLGDKPDKRAENVAVEAGKVAKAEEEKDAEKMTIQEATERTEKGIRETPEIEGDAMKIEEEIEEGVTIEDDKAIESAEIDEKMEESQEKVDKVEGAKE